MNRRTFLKTVGLGMISCGMPGCLTSSANSESEFPRRPRNIVFILADDIGYGDLSCYGPTPGLTPFIDTYVKSGVRFTHVHSPSSVCTPTRFSIFTGSYAWRTPGTFIAPGDAALLIPPSWTTLQRLMQRSGMVTGAVGKWHLGMGPGPGKTDWNKPITPSANDTGFDYTFLMAATADRVPCVYVENGTVVGLDPNDPIEVNYKHNYPGEPDGKRDRATLKMDWGIGHNMAVINGIGRIGYMKGGKKAIWKDEEMADVFTEKACAFMERHKDEPFFLYLGTNDIHVPRVPHPRFVGSTGMGVRGDAIRQFDDTVRRVIEKLYELGLREETLVVITSDNGPVLNDGYKDRAVELNGNHLPNNGLKGWKFTPYLGETRVPFIVSWPGTIPGGQTCDAHFSLVDLAATFTVLRGVSIPEKAFPDSYDLSACFLDPAQPSPRKDLICQDPVMSLCTKRWKYILPADAGNNPLKVKDPTLGQLYDLANDPTESKNLAKQRPDVAKQLFDRLKAAVIQGHTN